MSLATAAVIGRLLGPRGYTVGEETPISIPWAAFLPMVCAYLIAGSVLSPVAWLERQARRRTSFISLAHTALISGLACLFLWWGTSGIPPPLSELAAIRNFLGLTGISLLCVITLGAGSGWLLPTVLLVSAIVVRSNEITFPVVAWLLAPDDDQTAFQIAIVLFLGGLSAIPTRLLLRRNASE